MEQILKGAIKIIVRDSPVESPKETVPGDISPKVETDPMGIGPLEIILMGIGLMGIGLTGIVLMGIINKINLEAN